MKSLALCLLFAACSSSSPPATTVTPAPTTPDPAPATPDPAPAAGAPLGQPCGADDACATGTECVKYYGIAGPRGPEFKSCEIRCKADDSCPPAHRCATIADGPGQVCRPKE